ncbi:lmo0937 family membrane protein [Bacillus solitudinis]|nr:lmo0937 family membrane protein [Bacillus solitudinis]
MLWLIFFILLIMWLFGFISGNVLGGYLHILLIVAVVVVLIRIIQGRRPL